MSQDDMHRKQRASVVVGFADGGGVAGRPRVGSTASRSLSLSLSEHSGALPPCTCSCHHSIPIQPHHSYEDDKQYSSDTEHDSLVNSAAPGAHLGRGWFSSMATTSRGSPVLLGTLACLGIIYLLWRTSDSTPLEIVEPVSTALCDPFAEPGFLHYDKTQPKAARWIPFAEACDPAPDWLALFDAQDYEALSFLANRTILILGDSVDRNGLEHLAVMLGLPRYPVPYSDFSKKGEVPEGWDERGIPWVVEVPWLDLTFTNGFMYGLDDEDNFRQQPDWHPPGLAEDRIDQLFKVHTDQLKYPPSFISIHSGLWDLAFFGRQDRVRALSTEIPLTHERMTWWQGRMTHLLNHVNTTWPGAPVWMRKLHRVGPVGGASYDWRHTKESDPGKVEHFSNFFTDLRIHQIREMQEQVAISTGIPSFDFGEIWEGWQSHQQMVHPLIYPGGPAYAQGLIHHIWMESKGRDSWALSKARTLSPFFQPSVDLNQLD